MLFASFRFWLPCERMVLKTRASQEKGVPQHLGHLGKQRRADLSHWGKQAKLLHHAHRIVVLVQTNHLPIPDLMELAEADLDPATGWRKLASRALEGASVSAAPNKGNRCLLRCGEEVGHLYLAIGE